jgi:YgiT-type zinc finger domain-containing protein
MTEIRCSACGEGHLAEKVVSHDVGPLLGMSRVKVEHLPALACSKCGVVTVQGEVLDAVAMMLADSADVGLGRIEHEHIGEVGDLGQPATRQRDVRHSLLEVRNDHG